MKREQFENAVREQISRAVANALQSGVPSSGMLNRCTEGILQSADRYTLHVVEEAFKPIPGAE